MSEQIAHCEQCLQRYTLFRRKKQCDSCGQIFCSKCVSKSSSSTSSNDSRTCKICLLIINQRTTRDQLKSVRVKHLRAYLIHSKIISLSRLESCFEKEDLINLIESRKRQTPDETYVFVERRDGRFTEVSNNNTTRINTSNQPEVQEPTANINEEVPSPNTASSVPSNELTTEAITDPLPVPPVPPKIQSARITLDNLSSSTSIQNLTVGQLKDVLAQNFVSYKGCVEKTELINKVELLYRDHQQQNESNTNISTGQSDDNLCRICMDATIDCVFLDCGHLCTCVQCGKRLSECPLCRSYIVRVVRVFKG